MLSCHQGRAVKALRGRERKAAPMAAAELRIPAPSDSAAEQDAPCPPSASSFMKLITQLPAGMC